MNLKINAITKCNISELTTVDTYYVSKVCSITIFWQATSVIHKQYTINYCHVHLSNTFQHYFHQILHMQGEVRIYELVVVVGSIVVAQKNCSMEV